jgi:hypothetical protein
MDKTDPLICTKLRLPFTRPELVPRPRLQKQIEQGLRGPLTLTVVFDHDVIDGAPAARFAHRLVELIESRCGLYDKFPLQG